MYVPLCCLVSYTMLNISYCKQSNAVQFYNFYYTLCNEIWGEVEWWVLCSAYFTIKYRYKNVSHYFCLIFLLLYTWNKHSFIVCCCLNVELYYQMFTTAIATNRISASYGRTNVHSARRKKCLRHLSRFSKTKLLKTDILHMTVINFIRLSWK